MRNLTIVISSLLFLLASMLLAASEKDDVAATTLSQQQIEFVQQAIRAKQLLQPMPHISALKQKTSLNQAYAIQKEVVEAHQTNDVIAGYKAGLTSSQGQAKFKVTAPLSGVLFSSGLIQNNQTIRLDLANKLMLETELGFFVAIPISQPINDITQLKKAFSKVAAVIELPDLGYQQMQAITGVDLVAANLASHQFIIGNRVAVTELNDIDSITTRLSFNQQQLFIGKASDAMEGQWQALLWLVNHLVEQGYELSVGEVLITGALGKMVAAQAGHYIGEFGPLGKIEFTIN
jgi:2-keto-4-pentenoate hydratase